jgi:hypothetical protein
MARPLVEILEMALDVPASPWLNGTEKRSTRQPRGAHAMTTAEFLLDIHATKCESCSDALQHADASGFGEAILLDGKAMVVPQADCDRLQAAGVGFAYLHNHEMPDGSYRIMTVPVD